MNARQKLCIAALIVLALGCEGSRSDPVSVRSQGLEMQVSVEPPDLRVGANTLWLELRDERGAPVSGAVVEVKVHMHAMGAMPAMGGTTGVSEVGGGRYRADFELEMGSTWMVEIAARPTRGPVARAEGSLTVGTPGVRLEGVGPGAQPSEPGAEPEAQERHPAEFRIAPRRLQRIGVKTARAEKKRLETAVRAVGRVVAEETTLADVSLRVRGWVGEVVIDAVGDPVKQGDVLFTVYSPELYAAQEEYLQALRSRERARGTTAPDRAAESKSSWR